MSSSHAAFVVRHFADQHYSTVFNPHSGFFARIEDEGYSEPFWSIAGPELIDIAITNWCDRGCFFCYRKSDEHGSHMSLTDYRDVIAQARGLGVFQVALGGGNPNQHPDFVEMLRATRLDFGIVPNYTTNGRGLTAEIVRATKAYCGAVAVSAYAPYDELSSALGLLASEGVRANVHFMLTSSSVNTAIDWLTQPPPFLANAGAVVFLNYKPVGRVANDGLLLIRSPRLEEFFKLATRLRSELRIGFDTCTVTGLARYGEMLPASVEGCDAGRFSMFVSERLEVYPCSFMVEAGYNGIPMTGSSLPTIWRDHPEFQAMREKHSRGACADCTTPNTCLSGCPLFPQMNLCPSRCGQPAETELVQILRPTQKNLA